MSDLSDQMRALATELNGLRSVLDSVGAYIFTKDLAGRYTFANDQVCQLFGRPLAQIVGQDDSVFFDLDRSNALRENDRRVLDGGETLSCEEINIIRPSGQTRIYLTVKTPVRGPDGEIVGMSGISTDITERKALERELAEQRELLDTVLNNVDASVYMKSRDRRFLYVNHQTAELFGQTPAEVAGKLDTELMPQEAADRFWELDQKVFATHCKHSAEEQFVDAAGNLRHYWSIKVPMKPIDDSETLIGFSTDITELHLLKEELQRQAYTDMLTGVSNRRHFFQEAIKEFSKSRRYGHALSVMVIDLDHFKQINDGFGHQAGDIVLCEVARHCQRAIRDCDVFGRLGGEEFAILLPNTALAPATGLATRLCAALREIRILGDWAGPITPAASIGVAAQCEADHDFHALLARADQALYRAKDGGRDRVCAADPTVPG